MSKKSGESAEYAAGLVIKGVATVAAGAAKAAKKIKKKGK